MLGRDHCDEDVDPEVARLKSGFSLKELWALEASTVGGGPPPACVRRPNPHARQASRLSHVSASAGGPCGRLGAESG